MLWDAWTGSGRVRLHGTQPHPACCAEASPASGHEWAPCPCEVEDIQAVNEQAPWLGAGVSAQTGGLRLRPREVVMSCCSSGLGEGMSLPCRSEGTSPRSWLKSCRIPSLPLKKMVSLWCLLSSYLCIGTSHVFSLNLQKGACRQSCRCVVHVKNTREKV